MSKKKSVRVFHIFLQSLPYIFVFIASLYLPKDPDLGWHLKYGEYFFVHHQVLRDNIFSTMMPNYHWANGSWGTDILTYAIYNTSGFLGLTLASSLIVTLTFFFFARTAKLTLLVEAILFPILIFIETPINSYSFRGQQISLLFLGVLFYILSKYQPFSKRMFLVPVLFFIWCNVHEESFLGIALFGLWIGFTLIKSFFNKTKQSNADFFKEFRFLAIIFGLTIFASFINPFGFWIHLFALSHLNDPLLKKVSEYDPFIAFSSLWLIQIAVTFVFCSITIFLTAKKRFLNNLPILGIPFILLIASFMVRRYVWPTYYFMLPVVPLIFKANIAIFRKYTYAISGVLLVISLGYIINLKSPINQFTTMSWNTFCNLQPVPCSPDSAIYLTKHNLSHNLYSYYDWGGWLIWNYPQIKPSIDGRMHLWRDQIGSSASSDYDAYFNNNKNIDASPFDTVYISQDRSPLYQQLSDLVTQQKWNIAYEDDVSVIVVRKKK